MYINSGLFALFHIVWLNEKTAVYAFFVCFLFYGHLCAHWSTKLARAIFESNEAKWKMTTWQDLINKFNSLISKGHL